MSGKMSISDDVFRPPRHWANKTTNEYLTLVHAKVPADLLGKKDYASRTLTMDALCQYLDRLSQNHNLDLSANNPNPWRLQSDLPLMQRTLKVQSKTPKCFWSFPSSAPADDILKDACAFIDHVSSHHPSTTSNPIMFTERVPSTTGLVIVRPLFLVELDKSSALFKIKELADTLFEYWLPRCEQFIQYPPSTAKTRKIRGKMLNEGLMAQIVLQSDGIESGGNEGVRATRKIVAVTSEKLAVKINKILEDNFEDCRPGTKRAHPGGSHVDEPPAKRLATTTAEETESGTDRVELNSNNVPRPITETSLKALVKTQIKKITRMSDKESLLAQVRKLDQDGLKELRMENEILTNLLKTRDNLTEEEVLLLLAQESENPIEE